MAAPARKFGPEMKTVLEAAPLNQRIGLTHSSHDTANCVWHAAMEREPTIG